MHVVFACVRVCVCVCVCVCCVFGFRVRAVTRIWGVGFMGGRVYPTGLPYVRVQGSGFRVQGLRLPYGLGFRVYSSGLPLFRVQGLGFRV